MKIKNIIILGGIVFAIYYLSKKKSSTITATVTPDVEGGDSVPDIGDINLENVMNGDSPQSEAEADVLRLFKKATKYYTGGARPTRQVLSVMEVERQKALLEIIDKGLSEKFKEWKEKFGKKKKIKYPVPMDRIADAGFKPKTREQIIKELESGRRLFRRSDESLSDYQSRLGLINMPPMAL